MKSCYICRKDIKDPVYTCCKQTKFYCLRCPLTICRTCDRSPKLYNKQKSQATSRFSLTCDVCKQNRSLILYQNFVQPKCKYTFCPHCLIILYERYYKSLEQIAAQEGIRPEFPFQLPCRCQLSQKQILIFLQKSCYCCNMKIESSQTYRLNNNLRVMKKCMNKLERKLNVYRAEKEQFEKLDKMILRCEGCDFPLDQILSNEQNLNVCKQCVQLNKRSVKQHEKEKQLEKSAKKKVQEIQVQVKIDKAQKKSNINGKSNKNEMKILKEEEITISKVLEQSQQQKEIKQQKKVQENKANPKVKQQSNQHFLQDIVQPKTMDLSDQIFQNLKECKECSIMLPQQDLIVKTLQQVGSNLFKTQVKDINEKQNGLQKQSICKLCYFQVKSKQKIIERQKKIEQKMDRSRLYNSTKKAQKKIENKSNIFARFDPVYPQPSTNSKKLNLQKPYTDKRPHLDFKLYTDKKPSLQTTSIYTTTSNNFLYQKCKKCLKRVYISQFKQKLQLCKDCECQALEKQNRTKKVEKIVEITCKICYKQKILKQSEVGRYGFCKQCSLHILR